MFIPDLQQIVSGVTFVGVRIGGVLIFAPFTGSDSIASPIKAVLALLITALLYPVIPLPVMNATAMGWVKVVAGEAILGMALGLILQFSFEAAQFAGQLFGMQTGFSLVTILDPQSQSDSPSLSVFTQLFALLLFLQGNVHHWILLGLASSFSYVPPGALGNVRGIGLTTLKAAGGLWMAGMQVAAPVLAVTLLADIVLGFVGKVAPQLPATLAGLPVKSVFGLTVLALSLKSWPAFFEHYFEVAVKQSEGLLRLASAMR